MNIQNRFGPAVLLGLLNIWIIIEFKKISKRRRVLTNKFTELSGFPTQSLLEVSQKAIQLKQEENEVFINFSRENASQCQVERQENSNVRVLTQSNSVTTMKNEIKLTLNSPNRLSNTSSKIMSNRIRYEKNCRSSSFTGSKNKKLKATYYKASTDLKLSVDIKDISLNKTASNDHVDENILNKIKLSPKKLTGIKSNFSVGESPSLSRQKNVYKNNYSSEIEGEAIFNDK